ncbi:MAG: RecX family transcriptional regulator [Chloroflexota bacterium]
MDPDKVHIFVDGKHALVVSLDVAAAERLIVGQPCPPERLEKILSSEQQQQIYEAALVFLSYRPRSAREVEQRLRKKGYLPNQIDDALARLRKKGYVNDMEFARFWVNNRQAFNPRGPRLLRSELRQKGVPQEIVDAILTEHREEQSDRAEEAAEIAAEHDIEGDEPAPGTDEATALSLARKRMRLLSNLDPVTRKRRLTGFLARRGYGFDVISAVMQRVLTPDETEDDGMEDD